MEHSISFQDNEQFVADLASCNEILVEKLQNKDYAQAAKLIQSLIESRDRQMFQSIGELTRNLHDSVVNLKLGADAGSETADADETDGRQMAGHLRNVIEMMHSAADNTLDKIETIVPIAAGLCQEAFELQGRWEQLKNRKLDVEEFRELYDRMDKFLSQALAGTAQISNHSQDIMLEQSYQDLTGQVLLQITNLVTDIEAELVRLMRLAQIEDVPDSELKKKKSRTDKSDKKSLGKKRKQVMSNQDEVDELLSNLGF